MYLADVFPLFFQSYIHIFIFCVMYDFVYLFYLIHLTPIVKLLPTHGGSHIRVFFMNGRVKYETFIRIALLFFFHLYPYSSANMEYSRDGAWWMLVWWWCWCCCREWWQVWWQLTILERLSPTQAIYTGIETTPWRIWYRSFEQVR